MDTEFTTYELAGRRHKLTKKVTEVTTLSSLDRHVTTAIKNFIGYEVERDEDGEYMVPVGAGTVWVESDSSRSSVEIRLCVATDILLTVMAAYKVHELNRDWPYLKFSLTKTYLVATHNLLAAPFVEQHFIRIFDDFVDLSGHIEDIATELGGRTLWDSAE